MVWGIYTPICKTAVAKLNSISLKPLKTAIQLPRKNGPMVFQVLFLQMEQKSTPAPGELNPNL